MKAPLRSSGLRLAVLLIGMLVFGASFCHADIAVVDDTGGQITIAHPARRIIAIAPNLAELAYAAGAGQWLIAAVRGTDYPPVASLLPRVGDAAGLDFEQIRRLEPDLVLAWGSGNKQSDLDRLARNGVAVVVFEARTLGDVSRHLRMIGRLAGSEREAEHAAMQFGNHLARLRATYATNCVVDVFVEIWHQPVFTVGPSHALSDALHVCGARNVAHDYPLLAGPIPLENVLVARPEAILSVTGGAEADAQARWDKLLPDSDGQSVPVVSVMPELLVRSGPRMLNGVELLCARLALLREPVCRASQSGK